MNRGKQMGFVAGALLSALVAGCGGSATSPVGTSGSIHGTVTRVLIPGIPDGEPFRSPYADMDVEIFQGTVLKKTAQTDAEGRFTVAIPVGNYRVKASDWILERTPAIISSAEVTVVAGKTVPVELEVTIPAP